MTVLATGGMGFIGRHMVLGRGIGEPLTVKDAPPRPWDISAVISDTSRAHRVLKWCTVNSQINMVVHHSLKREKRRSHLADRPVSVYAGWLAKTPPSHRPEATSP